ncbi:MAG TPA: hypothetical protein VIL37_00035 [Natronosporangium sp.]
MAVDAYEALKEFVEKLLNKDDPSFALQYAGDPEGTLAEQGITDADLSGVDLRQIVAECSPGFPASTQQALQSYTSGGGSSSYPVSTPPATSHTATEVVQHLNYVTYATYEDNDTITQQLINYEDNRIDNSINVDGDVDGDLDIDSTNVNATGDGAVAAGDDAEGVATGDGAIAAGDDIEDSVLVTGDGAVGAGGNLQAPVNTGEFTGVQADGDVENTVVGDDNQVAQVDGDAENSVFNFGDGDVTNFGEAEIDDAAIATGSGDATNVSDNELEEGAAISGTGDAEGNFEEETEIEAEDSFVVTEQGPGDLEQEDNEFEEVAGA